MFDNECRTQEAKFGVEVGGARDRVGNGLVSAPK